MWIGKGIKKELSTNVPTLDVKRGISKVIYLTFVLSLYDTGKGNRIKFRLKIQNKSFYNTR